MTSPESTPPQSADSGRDSREPAAGGDRTLAWVLVAATAAVFWPVTRWMVEETVARQQIRQAFILLVAAAGLVAWQHRAELRVRGDLCNRTLGLLAAAFGLVALAAVSGWSLLVLPGLALALAGCLQALFGEGVSRFFRPLVAGVVAFGAIIAAFPLFDWPLRQLAGVGAAKVLDLLRLAPQLRLAGTESDPQLVLSVAEGHFLVATECNGFGLITSAALLTILAGGIAGRRAGVIAALVPPAVVIGFAVNVARILVISTTARYFPGHYDLLHEAAGTLALWGGLGLVGWLAWRPSAGVSGAWPQR
ncbi:MAG: exosortase/archaeosortase family protein, partial [Opitutaceae bacterium]|nr:exosortase/archaeosortase family protein [Opitutaceae bacterium]